MNIAWVPSTTLTGKPSARISFTLRSGYFMEGPKSPWSTMLSICRRYCVTRGWSRWYFASMFAFTSGGSFRSVSKGPPGAAFMTKNDAVMMMKRTKTALSSRRSRN